MKSNFLKLTYFLSVFAIFSSVYLDTYWSEFGINIFPYIELGEILTYGLKPLMGIAIPLLIGLLIAFLFFDKIFPYGGYKDLEYKEKIDKKKYLTKLDKIMYWVFFTLFFVMYPIRIVYLYFYDITGFYSNLPFFSSIFSLFLTEKLITLGYIKNINIDFKLIFFSSYLIISSYTIAKSESKLILRNDKFNYIDQNENIFKLLGSGKNFYFLKPVDNNGTIILNKRKINKMNIKYYDGNIQTKNDSIICKLIEKDPYNLW